MEFIKSILRKIDIFGVPYSFKYKSEEKYTTSIGGFVVIIFFTAALVMGIYYFIPFYKRKNFTTVYYTLSTSQADRINFAESKTALAFGLNCWKGKDNTTADQLFKIDYKYIHWKLINGVYNRTISNLKSHQCTKKDFYNEFNETFDGSEIYKYECLDDPSITIEGIWTSEIFSYFQFEVNAKNNSKNLLNKINDYLLENDCKLQIYFSDNTVDIKDYKNPIKSYVEAIFIQINPTLSIRRNLYFMNQFLFDDDFLFWVFNDEEEARVKRTLFSRFEEYSLFQGIERNKLYTDYLNFVKLYIRADTKKTEIKRKYQKINEFYADASSLLIAVYEILIIVFELLNFFWAHQSLARKIFFFQDFDYKLNINDKSEKIRELLVATDTNNQNQNFKQTSKISIEESSERNLKAIQNFHDEKTPYIPNKCVLSSKNIKNVNNLLTQNEDTQVDIDYNYEKISNSYRGREYNINSKDDINYNKRSINNNINEIHDYTTENNLYNITIGNNNDKETAYEEKEEVKIKYKFTLWDKIRTIICNLCLSNNLKIKKNFNEKAQELLDSKLDVVLYVRNVMLFEILNETFFLDSDTKDIINFLARPIISLESDEESQLSLFYNKYKENDFEKFYKEVIQLSNKTDKRKEEIKLISICNKHLKQINF